ncbi:MAG: MMPL family transporter [Bacteroidia bacterium]|nr:MMPL family transporter [Bacteroidia bacterium]MCZ2276495.1 MMPL family transporter [Bacteroidia bacterium]
MFRLIARIILRNRYALLVVMVLLTAFFGYQASHISLSYEFAKSLPTDDPDYIAYEKFKKTFGEDGSVMVIGIKDSQFFTPDRFNEWYRLGKRIKEIDGIEAVISVAAVYNIHKNEDAKKFEIQPLVNKEVTSQQELDSIRSVINNLPFYNGFIINKETQATLMAVTFDKNKLNTRSRIGMVQEIKDLAFQYGHDFKTEVHISGLPYIRTVITAKVASELKLFLVLALLVCAAILFAYFRSFRVVIFSLLVVLTAVIWSVGVIVLYGYKITILTGLIPSLIIVIGIPNSILQLNKYHTEYARHGNKIKALQQMVQRIGFTTFLANLCTTIGFGVFYFTHSTILMEFGLVAATNIMLTYLISLILIPVIFSFLAAPDAKHTGHLEAKRISAILSSIDRIIHSKTRLIFGTVTVLLIIAAIGISRIKTVGYVVDDLPKEDPVYVDLKFFEHHFHGVLPMEVMIDTKVKGGALKHRNLQKLSKLTKLFQSYDEFAKPLSIADGMKFINQAYHDGNPKYYILPTAMDLGNLSNYIGDSRQRTEMFRSFLDSNRQVTRFSAQVADIGSQKMDVLLNELRPRIDSIFPQKDFNTVLTGNSLIFLKSNGFLVKHLIKSVALAIFLITIVMFSLFMSTRMIALSILPSIIPLTITAGIMGFAGVPLKPSTILIFSIAFGISADGTIYFLTKYRQEMKQRYMTISKAVSITIKETGVSIVYAATILFCGFFIFNASEFGGTAALGKLLSVTLLVAMSSNLILLPAFLVTLERRMTTRAFLEEPLVQFMDEDEDIELQQLDINQQNNQKNSGIKTL